MSEPQEHAAASRRRSGHTRGGRGRGKGIRGGNQSSDHKSSSEGVPSSSSADAAAAAPSKASQPVINNSSKISSRVSRGGRGRGRHGRYFRKKTQRDERSSPAEPSTSVAAADENKNMQNTSEGERRRPKRKARSKIGGYTPFQDMTELTKRYTSGDSTLIRGKIRMLPGKDAAAFVTCDRGSQERDVLIATMRDQNRSLDGDLVFVELLDDKESVDSVGEDEGEDEDDLTEEEAEHETAVEHNDQDRVDEVADILHDMAVGGGIPKDETNFKDEFCQETWKDDSVQKALWNPQVPVLRLPANTTTCTDSNLRIQLKGRVVCVIPPKESAGTQASELSPGLQAQYLAPRRTIVGTLKSVIPRNKSKERPLYLLTPTNKSLPQFLCPSSFQPSPVPDVAGNEEHGLYRAEYIYGSWGVSHNWPPCVNVKAMGKTCNVHDETLALLVENGVNHGDFESDVLKDVQEAVGSGLVADSSDLGWKPTPDMYKGRRDYRNQRIFTIDPTTAKDLDDALHITPLPNGQVEIGVHIADVSYFVRPETAVDTEATRRATTVYLVDRVIPMLPRPLCEVACSLNENVERLAFSCIWRMNLDGTLESKKENDEIWYGRTVIKSCARLDYATAQNIIDNKVANGESAEDMDKTLWPPSRRPTCGHTVDEVAADVRLMHKVAMARRRLRFMNGAVALNGVKLSFKLDTDGETPLLCAPYPIRDSNRLVEEYMLLANYLVAQRLITHAGGLAVLRHHPPPLQQGMQSVVEIAKEGKGFEIDASTSQSLQASLSRLSRECDDELVMQCVTELLMTPMKPAEYMAAGTFEPHEWRHFALNIPYYTHFTSPIRRYADVMVHRLLQATIEANLNEKIIFNLEQHEIQAICEHCNEKKMASKAAQDRSDRVFLAIYLKHNPIRSTLGVVISVGERTFTIFIKELGCSGKLFLDEHKDMVDSEPYTANSGQRRIRLKSKGETDWSEIDIKVFSMLKVSVLCKEKPPIDIKLRLESPWSG